MCAGVIVLARVPLVVFGAPDSKAGAVMSIAQVFDERGLNHHPRWRMGVLRAESETLLKEFFAAPRAAGGVALRRPLGQVKSGRAAGRLAEGDVPRAQPPDG